MKEGIHPNYPAARVVCACGNSFVTRSTKGDSSCHPFFTGRQKLVDTAGRVDRFRKRYEKKVAADAAVAAVAAAKAAEPKASESKSAEGK